MLPQVTAAMPDPSPMHPPDWTPKPPKLPRTPLPSTRVRVSPSPHRGSRCSPVITVSTTSTPIQPLQGNTQQYVIVQGNHRHLRGLPSYKDSFYTPTVDQAGHQPIYLQGKNRIFCIEISIFHSYSQNMSATLFCSEVNGTYHPEFVCFCMSFMFSKPSYFWSTQLIFLL